MRNRVKLVEIELSAPAPELPALRGFSAVRALARLHGTPLGFVDVPVRHSGCTAALVREKILQQFGWDIVRLQLQAALLHSERPSSWRMPDLLELAPESDRHSLPRATVAVCTRNRVFELARCLDSLAHLNYPSVEILVVDNAPNNDSAELLVSTRYPQVRYIRENCPGLNWARNRAIAEATGEIIAFIDDDAIADSGWLAAIAHVFKTHPEAGVVTGSVVPCELETEAQLLYESLNGADRSFRRHWIHRSLPNLAERIRRLGSGTNMAFRRRIFERTGYFDPALDVGTTAHAGGDWEIFFRVVQEGFTMVFEPGALVRHRHRRDFGQLRAQIAHKSIGHSAFLVRSALAYPEQRLAILGTAVRRIGRHVGQMLASWFRPGPLPHDLLLVQLAGFLIGLTRYQKARAVALQLAGKAPPVYYAPSVQENGAGRFEGKPGITAIRCLELHDPLPQLENLERYNFVRVYVTWKGRLLGHVEIANGGHPVSREALSDAIVDHFGVRLLEPDQHRSTEAVRACALAAVYQKYSVPDPEMSSTELAPEAPVSVVIATRDRPHLLRACLRALIETVTSRKLDIIVVDNNPSSGLTGPVIDEFPQARLVNEPRRGLAYARNAGFIASTSEIIVTLSDRAIVPPGWLDKLLQPFEHRNVMAVAGAVLPHDQAPERERFLESWEQRENQCRRWEVDKQWFKKFRYEPVPVWRLGSMDNAAFRAAALTHSRIGLLDEALGEDTATSGGEDIYLFYQVLKAGFQIVHEPAAFVWQQADSRAISALRAVFQRSKARVAYQLTTLLRDCDMRAACFLALRLPVEITARLFRRLAGAQRWPWSWIIADVAGALSAPWCLWISRRSVERNGRSGFYIPVAQRSGGWWEQLLDESSHRRVALSPETEPK